MAKTKKKIDTLVDRNKFYTLADAVKILKDAGALRKISQSVEVSMNLGLDTKQADQQLRGMIELPHGTGKKRKVAVFAKDAKAKEAKEAGAEIVGAEDLFETINGGKVDFDVCIATPDMMGLVGRLGKVLGPRGLMPNPKLGTVTMDVKKAIAGAKGGSVEYRAEKAGIVQAGVGKLAFTDKQILENVKTFIDTIQRARPSGAKGTYVKKIVLSSTMGPGVKIDLTTLAA